MFNELTTDFPNKNANPQRKRGWGTRKLSTRNCGLCLQEVGEEVKFSIIAAKDESLTGQ